MREFIFSMCIFTIWAGEVIACVLYSLCFEAILEKLRIWKKILLLSLGFLMISTILYSWLPGRLGYQLGYEEYGIIFQDGAIIANFGILLNLHAISLAGAGVKYIWECIRKRNVFSVKLVFLYIMFMLAFGGLGYLCSKNEMHIDFSGGEGVAKAVEILLALPLPVVIFLVIRSAINDHKKGR